MHLRAQVGECRWPQVVGVGGMQPLSLFVAPDWRHPGSCERRGGMASHVTEDGKGVGALLVDVERKQCAEQRDALGPSVLGGGSSRRAQL